MNWKNYVEKMNAAKYVLPDGWDSKETVAEQLGCSPDRVNEHLKPGIQSKEVEARAFPVWDSVTKRILRVTAYKFNGKPAK